MPGQGDRIIAITCMSHASSQATSKAQPAAPAAELQLEGVTAEDEGLEGVLEGDLEGRPSAEGDSLETGVLGDIACMQSASQHVIDAEMHPVKAIALAQVHGLCIFAVVCC